VVLQFFAVFNHAVLKTNFYRANAVALSFRLDPAFLSADFPARPHGIFMSIGAEYRGFHVRSVPRGVGGGGGGCAAWRIASVRWVRDRAVGAGPCGGCGSVRWMRGRAVDAGACGGCWGVHSCNWLPFACALSCDPPPPPYAHAGLRTWRAAASA
jgi:hypothetical protein